MDRDTSALIIPNAIALEVTLFSRHSLLFTLSSSSLCLSPLHVKTFPSPSLLSPFSFSPSPLRGPRHAMVDSTKGGRDFRPASRRGSTAEALVAKHVRVALSPMDAHRQEAAFLDAHIMVRLSSSFHASFLFFSEFTASF